MENIPMTQIIDIVIVLVGIYSLFLCIQMKTTMKVHKNILAPEELEKCKDVEGFINYLFLPMLLFSIAVIACGVVGLVTTIMNVSNSVVTYVILAVFLVVFCIYSTAMRRAREKFIYS